MKSRIPQLRKRLQGAAGRAAHTAAQAAKATRDARCPVDTGALLNSGVLRQINTQTWQLREGDGLSYAPYVEYGTSRAAAQPHMTPAAETARSVLPGAARDEIQKALR
jgi:hypothetical protein